MRVTERRAKKILSKIDRIALIKDDPKTVKDDPKFAAMFHEATTAPNGTNQHTDNVSTLKPEYGTSRARPRLVEQHCDAKLPSCCTCLQIARRPSGSIA